MSVCSRNLWTLCLLYLVTLGCDSNLLPASENQPPSTSLANIPLESDTLFALVTMHWNGGDPDGFVSEYQYRVTSTYLFRLDSLVQDWVTTTETSVTLSFSSIDPLNRQRFEVRALDNHGTPDPTPAVRTFYTTQTFAPLTTLHAPIEGQELFVLESATDWWAGIRIIFSGSDEDGHIEEYGYSVDGRPPVWTQDTTAVIGPEALAAPLEGSHTIQVIARDNTDLVSSEGSRATIHLVSPRFDRDLLIIDETNEENFNVRTRQTDEDVDRFYANLFDPDASWDYLEQERMPSLNELGRYKFLMWHADDRPTSRPHALVMEEPVIRDYLNVGGSMIISGWRILKSFAWQENFPQTFQEGSFVNDYMQIGTVDETALLADFTGGIGVNGFPDVSVDATKLDYFPNSGAINNVNIIQQRGGFTELILSYDTSSDTNHPQHRGGAVGLIYFGTSFNAAVLGFPMFFLESADAKLLADAIMARIAN